MANNNTPVFRKQSRVGWGTVATANTALDGTGTVVTVFTAGGTNDSVVDYIKVKFTGTSVASVLRIFINNGSTNGTAANNSLFAEISLPANTLSQTAQSSEILIIPLDLPLPTGYKLNVTVGTTIANAVAVTAVGQDL